MLSKILTSRFKALTSSISFSQTVTPINRSCIAIHDPLLRSSLGPKPLKLSQTFIPLMKSSFRQEKRLRSLFKTAKRLFSTREEINEDMETPQPPPPPPPPPKTASDQDLLKENQEAMNKARKENNYTDFLRHAENIIFLKKKILGENYEEGLFDDLKNLGFGNFLQTKYTEALFYFDQAMKYAKKEIEFMEVYLYLGQLYSVMNNPESALEAFDQGYVHAKTLFSSYLEHPGETLGKVAYHTINISRNLIDIYRKRLNKVKVKVILSENIQMFNSLIRVSSAFKRQNTRDFLSYFYECCEELTEISLRNNDQETAERTIAHQLEAVKMTPDHFYMTRALFNQGLVFAHKEKFIEALTSFTKGKDVLEHFLDNKPKDSYFPNYHTHYISLMYMIYGGMTNAYFRLERREDGLKLIEEIENFYKTNPLEDPFAYDHIQTKKAEFFIEDKKFAEAFPILIQVNANLEKSDLNNLRNLTFRSYVLAIISNVGGEIQKYEEALKAALENEPLIVKLIKEFPDKKESVVDNKYNIGALYGRMKKYREAEKYLKEALDMFKAMDNRLLDVDRVYTDLAALSEEEGDKVKARQYYMNSMEIRKKLSKAAKGEHGMDALKEKIEELKPTPKKKEEAKPTPKKKAEVKQTPKKTKK